MIPHKPNDKTRAEVSALTGFGIVQEDIAEYLDISDKTLRKYYDKELRTGAMRANVAVARRLFQKCMDGDTTSLIFWSKTRAKWRETSRYEMTGADGVSLTMPEINVIFTDEVQDEKTEAD